MSSASGIQSSLWKTDSPIPPGMLTQQTDTSVIDFSGPFTSTQNATISFIKIGVLVTISIPAITASAPLAGIANATTGTAIPVVFRPVADVKQPCIIRSASSLLGSPGYVLLRTSGIIEIYLNFLSTGTFGVLGNNGWEPISFSYLGS